MPHKLRLADQIRQYAVNKYVRPARQAQKRTVEIRAGDIHAKLGLSNRRPAVCSALGSKKFQRLADVTLVKHCGPIEGSKTTFCFQLESPAAAAVASDALQVKPKTPSHPQEPIETPLSHSDSSVAQAQNPNLIGGLHLVSCVKSKLLQPAPAKDLYISNWFRKTRACVERAGGAWYILSAKYGLLHPNEVIPPYELTLKSMGITERRTWAQGVIKDLQPHVADRETVVMFAGARYREFLEPSLGNQGIKVDVPMRGLRQGQQLRWLNERLNG